MAQSVTQTSAPQAPAKSDESIQRMSAMQVWRPFQSLRKEVDQLFDDFGRDFWRSPFRRMSFDLEPAFRRELSELGSPAVDIVEKENAYEVTAELPGMDEKNIEVKVAKGGLVIRGEKQEQKEEKKGGYHLQERRFGSFERRFAIPEGVDADKIEASFSKGVLSVMLPKKPEAQKDEKKIKVNAA